MFQDHYNGRRDVRARPEVWIPILLDFYKVAERIVRGFSVDVAVAGAGAYAVHMDPDSTKDIDLVLSHPLSVGDLAEILNKVREGLGRLGYRCVGARIQQGRGLEDWVIQIFVAASPGSIVGLELFNLLATRPLSLYSVEDAVLRGQRIKVLSLESWIASKLADPNGVDELNLRRLERVAENASFSEAELFEILARLGLREIVKSNARDLLDRTGSRRLRELLTLLI